MDEMTPLTITLPAAHWRTVHALAFKAPTTGHECVFALAALHQALTKTAGPPADAPPAPPPAAKPRRPTPKPAPVAEAMG